MKKILLKSMLFIPMIIGMSYLSCKPDEFTEEEAMLLQAKLERELVLLDDSLNTEGIMLADSLSKDYERITYTLSLIDAYTSTLLKSESPAKGLPGATVTLTQDGTMVSKTTASTGMITFENLKKGLATLHIVLTGYSEVNAVIDFSYYGIGTTVAGGIQFGNVIPMIPTSGSSTGTIKGKVICETDLTNKVPENAPAGTKVIATVSTSSAALNSISGGIIKTISYDNLSLETVTDANGEFTLTVPGTSMGLNYALRVSDFTVNQSLLMLTKGGVAVTGVQTVPTSFGSQASTSSSSVPDVNPVIVTIALPDYTFTAASATAVVTNPNGLDYIQKTSSGNYYDAGNTFTDVLIDNPAPNAGGSNAYIDFAVNSSGQISATNIFTKGSGFSTSLENATYSLPYIQSAAKAVVLTVNGSGAITSWRVSPTNTGQFFSRTNLEFIRTLGSGTGAVLTLPNIFDFGSYLTFSTSIQYPLSPLGSGYAVDDEFTLQVKSGMSDLMTGKIHMTTGSVTAINVITEGSNYISGKVDVIIASPGVSGTTATAIATVSNGRIASINVQNQGSSYSGVPTVTIVNKVEKIQARATAEVNLDGNITGFTMDNTGNGYLAVPAVTLTTGISGLGLGASAVAVLSGGSVSSLNLINGGSGYTGVNTPGSAKNAPSYINATVTGSGTTIVTYDLGTGKRSIEY